MGARPVVTTPTKDSWEAFAPRWDRFATPSTMGLGERALDRVGIRHGTRLLDVGCGSGGLAIPAARRGARVTAVDVAPAMVDRLAARARAEGLAGVEARVMDATSLAFDDDAFDVAASQNGVSLLPQVELGLRELVRVTHPGGWVLVVAFGPLAQHELLGFLLGALGAVVPGRTPWASPPPLALQFADRDRFHRALVDAGLHRVRVEAACWDLHVTSGRDAWDVITACHPAAVQCTVDLTEAERTEVQHVLDGMLRERSGTAADVLLHGEMNVGVGRV